MIRSTPFRVETSSCTATSSAVPFFRWPPAPTYEPSVFSRNTTKSISFSPFPFSGESRSA